MQFKYCDTWGHVRGSTDYNQYEIKLEDGENIDRITGSKGWLFGTMHLYSTTGRDLWVYGGENVGGITYADPEKSGLAFLEGKFCLHYDYPDKKDRFCDVKLSYLYSN